MPKILAPDGSTMTGEYCPAVEIEREHGHVHMLLGSGAVLEFTATEWDSMIAKVEHARKIARGRR